MAIFVYGQRETTHLAKKCKKMGALIERLGPLEREVIPDLFCALISSIVAQQISSRAAATVYGRLQNKAGLISPASVSALLLEEIQSCGMSNRKAGYIQGIAQAALSGSVDFAALPALGDEEIIRLLSGLRGVGVWTAEMLLIFSLQRPDVVSYLDLGIRRGMMTLYNTPKISREQFARYRKRYSPYGTVASLYLWALAAC